MASSLKRTTLPIRILRCDNREVRMDKDFAFQYKQNPVIYNVQPWKSLPSKIIFCDRLLILYFSSVVFVFPPRFYCYNYYYYYYYYYYYFGSALLTICLCAVQSQTESDKTQIDTLKSLSLYLVYQRLRSSTKCHYSKCCRN